MEASLARKRTNPVANGLSGSAAADGQESSGLPSTSGAMDSLLEKLRAAAPQARDQRDRRRRARLKERHQVRVASGQRMPEVSSGDGGGAEGEASKESKESKELKENEGQDGSAEQDAAKTATHESAVMSEGDDIADRAASMLQGLRQGSGSDRAKRRESAEEARRNRRLRRRMAANNNANASANPNASREGDDPPVSPDLERSCSSAEAEQPGTPTITISMSQEGEGEEQNGNEEKD